MASLEIITTVSLSTQGITISGKQGTAANPATTAYTLSVSGTVHKRIGTITTGDANEVLVYDATVDLPATFDYGFLWADQNLQMQLLTGTSEVTIPILQYVPQPFGASLLASAATPPTNNVAEATLAAIDEITLGNYSGSTANYVIFLIN